MATIIVIVGVFAAFIAPLAGSIRQALSVVPEMMRRLWYGLHVSSIVRSVVHVEIRVY